MTTFSLPSTKAGLAGSTENHKAVTIKMKRRQGPAAKGTHAELISLWALSTKLPADRVRLEQSADQSNHEKGIISVGNATKPGSGSGSSGFPFLAVG
jgi:hypothetical protein